MYEDFRDHNQVFSGMFCFHATDMSISSDGKTERVLGEMVSGSYFPSLASLPLSAAYSTRTTTKHPAALPTPSSAIATG